MPRPKINTHALDLAEKRMLTELFGTPKHAYEVLRLAERGVTFVSFQRMWAGMEAPKADADRVHEHFLWWRADFLRETRPPTFKLDVEKWEDGDMKVHA